MEYCERQEYIAQKSSMELIEMIERGINATSTLPTDKNLTVQCLLLFCHAVAALPVLSGELARQSAEGAPYEKLVNSLGVLHKNIEEIARIANYIQKHAYPQLKCKRTELWMGSY